ncbi:MAG TPA: esterase-like activity of phytase family protein, partial [Pseudomonadales bacterium]|nr:esterase-like activity of phytase family protein [Pseudomonadales bacterium]
MEGLASADGQTLCGAMQSPLEQDGGTDDGYTRIARVDARTGMVKEIAHPLTNIGKVVKPKYSTVSDIVAINDHQLQVDERDGKGLSDGSSAVVKLTGFAFGPDADVDGAAKHTLFIANDNDYSSVVGGKSNPNQFCVIALDDGHWPRDQQDSSRRI